MDHVHDGIHILVCVRLFFGESLPAASPGDDALACQLLIDAATLGLFDGLSSTHPAACTVTRRAKRLLHATGLTSQDPTGAPHVAWDQDGLADVAIYFGNFWVIWWKGTRSAFAMDPDIAITSADAVRFQFGDIVGHIVDQVHLQFLPRAAKHASKNLTGLRHQQLTIAPCIIRRRTHRAKIMLAFGTVDRSASQLSVGQMDSVLLGNAA